MSELGRFLFATSKMLCRRRYQSNILSAKSSIPKYVQNKTGIFLWQNVKFWSARSKVITTKMYRQPWKNIFDLHSSIGANSYVFQMCVNTRYVTLTKIYKENLAIFKLQKLQLFHLYPLNFHHHGVLGFWGFGVWWQNNILSPKN